MNVNVTTLYFWHILVELLCDVHVCIWAVLQSLQKDLLIKYYFPSLVSIPVCTIR